MGIFEQFLEMEKKRWTNSEYSLEIIYINE